ncbi:UPF0280 family protein [Methanosphaerula palustris]|uniref:UPF0280 protein Mpal_1292 n=1 Tax=Methanosphaerula palustris (strain ATCC BAA-1556 / DSM 19958 / E1-9c) TaxID=521011 RepID=Y1292_METPE|nr:UPF0280 family protein [Methanosphaerula palustris]B8GHM1.1 RecName: Full=UPF0280 protein Mpal_1292 [Methanosphaerula palustris E1-9c]ACL16626.1 ApbE family lipoprotein [Methanosphaerula palustris E1-9c]
MIRAHFQFKETITTILAEEQAWIEVAKEAMITARQDLERYIARDPFFQMTLEPYTPDHGPSIAERMAGAAGGAGVGPMAAVAGTIAAIGVGAMARAGAAFGVIDNGGDIALITDRPLRIGIYAGTSPISGKVAFVLPPQPAVYGVCTSSATVGPSLSFGVADAVTVFASDPSVADAWATALCNQVRPGVSTAFDSLAGSGVDGAVAILGGEVQRWGSVPPMVSATVDENLITAGELY